MAIHIRNGKTKCECLSQTQVQYMPFKIAADCEANVTAYFTRYIKFKDDKCYASFRGFPLVGKKIDIPNGYKGVVLRERLKPATEESDRNFYATNKFTSFLYWNWGKDPSGNDPLLQAMNQWLDIAEALHAPVDED